MMKRTNKTSVKCSAFYKGSQPRHFSNSPSSSTRSLHNTLLSPGSITSSHFSLSLPIPPSINHQYATVQGRRVLSSTGRRYKAGVAQMVWAALAQAHQRQDFLHTFQQHFLSLTVRLYIPSLLRRDVDSGLKITQDALCEALGVNDNRIVEIHLYKILEPDHPRMECILSKGDPLKTLPSKKTSRPPTRKGRPLRNVE